MRGVTLSCWVAVAACSYDVRSLALDEPPPSDTDDGDSIGGDGLPNQAPVAVIGGPDVLPASAGQTFFVDGSGSFDPDGAPLTYDWALSAGCALIVVGSASDGTLTLSGAAPGMEPCVVTLTVSDGELSHAVSKTIVAVSAGTYVDNGNPACSDDFAAPGSGTRATPYCRIAAALDAARSLLASDVFVRSGLYAEDALSIPAGVTVRGSLDAEWNPPASWDGVQPSTEVSLSAAGVSFEESTVPTALDGLFLKSSATCASACALVRVSSAVVTLAHVRLETTQMTSSVSVAALQVVAGSLPTAVSFAGVVQSGSASPLTYGVLIDGRPSGSLGASLSGLVAFTGVSGLHVGVRSLAADRVLMRSLDIVGLGATTARGFALLDGAAPLALDADCGGLGACAGSAEIDALAGRWSSSGFCKGTGAALFDTRLATIAGTDILVDGCEVATGLHTRAVASLSGDLTARAVVTDGTVNSKRAIGWLDGDPTSGFVVGSADVSFGGSTSFGAESLTSGGVEELGGVRLADTVNARLEGCTGSASSSVSPSPTAGKSYGLWSTGTDGLRLLAGSYSVRDLSSLVWSAAVADGAVHEEMVPRASNDLRLRDLDVRVAVAHSDVGLPPRVISANGTQGASIEGNLIRGLPGPAAMNSLELVVLRKTSGINLSNNHVKVEAPVREALTGIRDGAPLESATPGEGSSGLSIVRNLVELPRIGGSTAVMRGLVLHGGDNVVVHNNALLGLEQPRAIGVQVVNRTVALWHNTIRLSGEATTGAFAIGVLADNGNSGTLDVLRNIIEPMAGTPQPLPVLLYNAPLSTAASWLSRQSENLHSGVALTYLTSGSSLPPVEVTPATVVDASNVAGVASYCADQLHLASRDGLLPQLDSLVVAADLDGQDRSALGPLTEVGADELLDSDVDPCVP